MDKQQLTGFGRKPIQLCRMDTEGPKHQRYKLKEWKERRYENNETRRRYVKNLGSLKLMLMPPLGTGTDSKGPKAHSRRTEVAARKIVCPEHSTDGAKQPYSDAIRIASSGSCP